VYYTVPAQLQGPTDISSRPPPKNFTAAAAGGGGGAAAAGAGAGAGAGAALMYHAFTPYELIRRTIEATRGQLYVPYFDKPMTFMLATHEYSHVFDRVVLLDIDEFLDCTGMCVYVCMYVCTYVRATTSHHPYTNTKRSHIHMHTLTQNNTADWSTVMDRSAKFKHVHELRIPRRAVNATISLEECKALAGCTFPDMWGAAFKWQKFSKVAVKVWVF
jgi:hypothetical protein